MTPNSTKPKANNFQQKRVFAELITKRAAWGLTVAFVCYATAASAAQPAVDPIDICIANAKDTFELFKLDEAVLENKCECVSEKRQGKLPSTVAGWEHGGKNRPAVTLIECAQSEIISFYSGVVYKSELARFEKKGVAIQDKNIQIIENYSACVGEGFYYEIKKSISNKTSLKTKLAKNRVAKMHHQCDITASTSK
jgi:hypothetical protein